MVQGKSRAVFVSGDIRIDTDYLEALRRNPILAPFIAYSPPGPFSTFTPSTAFEAGYEAGSGWSSGVAKGKGRTGASNEGEGDGEGDGEGEGDGDGDGEGDGGEERRPRKRNRCAATTTARPLSFKTLDRIYLDTSQVQLDEKLVPKVCRSRPGPLPPLPIKHQTYGWITPSSSKTCRNLPSRTSYA